MTTTADDTSVVRTQHGWEFKRFSSSAPCDYVRVRIMMAGLCRTDIAAMEGKSCVPCARVLGHEAAGIIEYIPSSQKQQAHDRHLDVGTRVAFFPFLPCGQCLACDQGCVERCISPQVVGQDVDGAFASLIHLPLSVLYPAPAHLSWQHLAYAEPVAASMAVTELGLTFEKVAIVGRGRIAKLTQRVLSTQVGIEASIMDPDQPCTEKGAFDVVIETWPSANALGLCVDLLRHDGLLVIKSRPQSPVPWPHHAIVSKRLRVRGAPYGSFAKGLQAMSNGSLPVDDMFGPVYAWNQQSIAQALIDERNGSETLGKIFFDIACTQPVKPMDVSCAA